MSTPDESKNKPAAKNNSPDTANSKTPENVDKTKVQSANSWETADLGDDERKKKFLRLMGASKSEHHGRFVIGDKAPSHVHGRDKKQTEEIEKELEDQYKHTFEHRITKWSHKGIGFEEKDEPDSTKQSEEDKEKKDDSEKAEASNSNSKPEEQSAKKRESTESKDNPDITAKKPKKFMNFVKSSDS